MAGLTEEEVFANDEDPMEAINAIRREEGVPEDELMVTDSDDSSTSDQAAEADEDGDEELDNLDEGTDENADLPDDENDDEGDDDGTADATDVSGDADESDDGDDEAADKAAVARKFRANGQDFEFTEAEMLEQFESTFGKAMDYTQKMQTIAPYRKMISALESENISQDQFNLALDALKGDKGAIKQLLDTNKIDAYDLNDDAAEEKDAYSPTDYGKNDVQLGIEEVANTISKDPEYKITVDVIDNQWDQTSRQSMASNPQLISGLHADIKSGVYDRVAPMAMKMKVLEDGNPKSDLEYYMIAGQKVMDAEKQTSEAEKTVAENTKKAQDADEEYDAASSTAKKKRSASTTRKRGDRKGVTDYLADDDEDFDAWYKNLQASN